MGGRRRAARAEPIPSPVQHVAHAAAAARAGHVRRTSTPSTVLQVCPMNVRSFRFAEPRCLLATSLQVTLPYLSEWWAKAQSSRFNTGKLWFRWWVAFVLKECLMTP